MEVQQNRSDKTGLALVAEKLITKEDPLFVHKILGVLVLLSYTWRFSLVFTDVDSDMGFKTYPEWTIPTLLVHAFLNISSFEFVIPKKRIKNGSRIWPEYRLHALVFLMRCVVVIAIKWYDQQYKLQAEYKYFLNYLAVLATMAFADFVSYMVGDYHSDSIRGTEAPVFVQGYFSFGQFLATSYALCGKRSSAIFYNAFMVQITPFLMTLGRKNLLSHNVNVFLYGVGIFMAMWLGHNETVWYDGLAAFDITGICTFGIIGLTAALWRMAPWPTWMRPFSNKYLIWSAMYLLYMSVLRPILETPLPDPAAPWIMSPAKKYVYWIASGEFLLFVLFMTYKQMRSMGGVGFCIGRASKNLSAVFSKLRYALHGVSSAQRSDEMGAKSKRS